MIGFKLVRKMKDGSLRPLFIERTRELPVGVWLEANDVPTKGYKHRPGWHILEEPYAPHLSKRGRVWVVVEFESYGSSVHFRPYSQGGTWYTARRMRIIGEVTLGEYYV